MEITVTIPGETSERMLGEGADPALALLELAGYTACINGRISEYEYMRLVGLETRWDVHALLKRLQSEADSLAMRDMLSDLATLGALDKEPKSLKSR